METFDSRIAIVSTPRSGNTWLRRLLGDALGLLTDAVHELTPDVLARLPEQCVLQIHWRREPEFVELLQANRFRVVTIVRHPLDVLISILQFAIHDSESDQWLRGRCGDEHNIFGAMPQSRVFREYATSNRVRELFGVSTDWWDQPDVVGVRYEDLVRDTTAELNRLIPAFRPEPAIPVAEAIALNEIGKLRATASNSHFWQGKPGLWKRFLTVEVAEEIRAAHADHFAKLGYTIEDADPELTPLQADHNWIDLAGPSLRDCLRRATSFHTQERNSLQSKIADLQQQCDAHQSEEQVWRSQCDQLLTTQGKLYTELDALRHQQDVTEQHTDETSASNMP